MTTTPEEDFIEQQRQKGAPFCDVCNLPAIWSETMGDMHVTVEHPRGVQPDRDVSGHLVSMREWARDIWSGPNAPYAEPSW